MPLIVDDEVELVVWDEEKVLKSKELVVYEKTPKFF